MFGLIATNIIPVGHDATSVIEVSYNATSIGVVIYGLLEGKALAPN
jgi:hypothetical protein